MDSSDSEKTNTDSVELEPTAKTSFFSNENVEDNEISSSIETILVPESSSDIITSVSESSSTHLISVQNNAIEQMNNIDASASEDILDASANSGNSSISSCSNNETENLNDHNELSCFDENCNCLHRMKKQTMHTIEGDSVKKEDSFHESTVNRKTHPQMMDGSRNSSTIQYNSIPTSELNKNIVVLSDEEKENVIELSSSSDDELDADEPKQTEFPSYPSPSNLDYLRMSLTSIGDYLEYDPSCVVDTVCVANSMMENVNKQNIMCSDLPTRKRRHSDDSNSVNYKKDFMNSNGKHINYLKNKMNKGCDADNPIDLDTEDGPLQQVASLIPSDDSNSDESQESENDNERNSESGMGEDESPDDNVEILVELMETNQSTSLNSILGTDKSSTFSVEKEKSKPCDINDGLIDILMVSKEPVGLNDSMDTKNKEYRGSEIDNRTSSNDNESAACPESKSISQERQKDIIGPQAYSEKSCEETSEINKNRRIVMEEKGKCGLEEHERSSDLVEYVSLQSPQQVGASYQEFQSKPENHLRGCLWSPDGSCLLTNSDDDVLRVFQIPDDILDNSITNELLAEMKMKEGETVYDMDWYPFMDLQNPSTCCFLSTSRDHPIHLWDSFTGDLRCTYRAFNQMDELTSAHCVAFNLDGSKIYCGFDKCIRIFDSSRPGNECIERCTVAKKNQSRKGKMKYSTSQPGIISSIAFSGYSGLYALGSFSRTVGLYDVNDGKGTCLLNGHSGGVTQVRFTTDGYYLISGARKDSELIWWDLRNTTKPLFKLLRNVATNQRIQFDIDRENLHVFSGSTDNMVNIWDLKNLPEEIGDDVVTYEPTYKFTAHNDAVNAVCLHPTKPLLATTSGQRHFFEDSDSESSSATSTYFENSMKIWKL